MSGGSGTGYPVMNRGLCCAQTGRSERKRGMEKAQIAGENKMILLFQGRRGFFFFFFFFSCRCKVLFGLSCEFSVELHYLLRTRQLGASGSRSVLCQLYVMKIEKQLRELLWGGHHKSQKCKESRNGWITRKNQNNLSETVNV